MNKSDLINNILNKIKNFLRNLDLKIINETKDMFDDLKVIIIIDYLTHVLFLGAYGEVRKCLNKQSKALRAVKIINKLTMAE